jgi:hypothetical protein
MINLNATAIVATKQQCLDILMCGVEPISVLGWCKDEIIINSPEFCEIPAWTLEELRVMIGQKVYTGLIDIVYDINARDRKGKKGEIMPEDTRFFANLPAGAKVYPNGAQAAAATVLEMIDNGFLDVEFINSRLKRHYKIK